MKAPSDTAMSNAKGRGSRPGPRPANGNRTNQFFICWYSLYSMYFPSVQM